MSNRSFLTQCVRVAKPKERQMLIGEMIRPGAMVEMIDDNFANYVVQTALDYADGDQRAQLLKEIMPLLNSIKSRSWYKRIMTKIGMGMNNSAQGQYETPRHAMPLRQYSDERVHPRMTSDQRSFTTMHGYNQIPPVERSVEHLPPGFMHNNHVAGQLSDRNGYRVQPVQPHVPQQYGNFYPYGPRAPVQRSEYRTNNEYRGNGESHDNGDYPLNSGYPHNNGYPTNGGYPNGE
jgi:hypothetical protein